MVILAVVPQPVRRDFCANLEKCITAALVGRNSLADEAITGRRSGINRAFFWVFVGAALGNRSVLSPVSPVCPKGITVWRLTARRKL